MSLDRFSVATFNLFNLQLPGRPMNPGQTPWRDDEFNDKVDWTAEQLHDIDADVVGLQELWSREAMERVLAAPAPRRVLRPGRRRGDGHEDRLRGGRPQGPAARDAAVDRQVP